MAEWASVSINDPKAPHWGGTLSAARMIMGKVGHSVFDYANKVIGPLLNSVLPSEEQAQALMDRAKTVTAWSRQHGVPSRVARKQVPR
ncbi:MAG: hypothetical protein DLM55_11950 [Acidimicrobiales bacterium]|nr:MAG: hypothetical protein DLM55_11950 [Acidimicrobiales bacterium]